MSPLDPSDDRYDEEQVRRLLASSREEVPVPADLAARLDAVLADLLAERGPVHGPVHGPVDGTAQETVAPLEGRRRRRVTTWLVAAAAAVVVGGVALGQVLPGGGVLQSNDSTATEDRAASDGGAEAEAGPRTGLDGDGEAEMDSQAGSTESRSSTSGAPGAMAAAPTELGVATFAEDVRALRDLAPVPVPGPVLAAEGCRPPGNGELHRVTYDGRPGVLVLRPAEDGSQQAEVFRCGEDQPARTILLPTP